MKLNRGRIANEPAEQKCHKALAIVEALGSKEGMANQLANLGSLFQQQGRKDDACGAWRQSLTLFRAIGSSTTARVESRMRDAGRDGA